MSGPELADDKIIEKLKADSGVISWGELKRFFANGTTVHVSKELDIVEIAFDFCTDHKSKIEKLMDQKKISKVTDEQAQAWYLSKAFVSAVVVSPWVLVQEK